MIFSYNPDEPQDFLEKGLKFRKIRFISLKILGGAKRYSGPPPVWFLGGGAWPPGSSTPVGIVSGCVTSGDTVRCLNCGWEAAKNKNFVNVFVIYQVTRCWLFT
jgi:hypothetical protein